MTACKVTTGGVWCTDEAAYRMWFDDCEYCQAFHGTLFCLGHWMCIQHTAKLRTGALISDEVQLPDGTMTNVPGFKVTPSRVCDAA